MMKRVYKVTIVIVLAAATLLLVIAIDKPLKSNHAEAYRQAMAHYPASPASDQMVYGFGEIYGDLKSPRLAGNIEKYYADSIYFNDTLNTFTEKTPLKEYLLHTAGNLQRSTVQIQDIARSGDDIYVRWNMAMELDVMGKQINSESVGITHLRFNDRGQITLHQDYWDGIDGFYQHLPYIGRWIRKLRDRL